MDTETGETKVIQETDYVIEEFVPDESGEVSDEPADGMDTSGDGDNAPSDEEISFVSEDEDDAPNQYYFYISGGAIIKVNKDDPEDTTTISRAGGRNYVYDQKTKTLYFLKFNTVVKETLGSDEEPVTLVDGIQASGNMIVDKKGGKLYVTDIITGKIIAYYLNTMEKSTIYSGLMIPNNLTPSDKFRFVNTFDSLVQF